MVRRQLIINALMEHGDNWATQAISAAKNAKKFKDFSVFPDYEAVARNAEKTAEDCFGLARHIRGGGSI